MKGGKNGRVRMVVFLNLTESHLMDSHCLAMKAYLWDKQQIHTFREEPEI